MCRWEYREKTVSEILLDSNQAMLITRPHTQTRRVTHTQTHTHIIYAKREQGRMKTDERVKEKITGKVKLKNTEERNTHVAAH